MRRLPPLSALRAFEAAARRLSFKRAADELNVTATAISHQIRLLEEWLGVRLFERETRKVDLTASGRLLFPAIRDGLDGFERAVAAVQRQRAANIATLSSTVAFVAKRLARAQGRFAPRIRTGRCGSMRRTPSWTSTAMPTWRSAMAAATIRG